MISIIIPVYQGEDTIRDCLKSVFAQTFSDVEVIVVNDGSTDRTREILEEYADRITIIDQENRGRNAARNRGHQHARGEYLIFLDADIVMQPDMLEKMYDVLQKNPHATYVYSSFQYGKKLFQLWPFSAERLKKMPYIMISALIHAKDFPRFDESVKRLQDWDVWLTMLEHDKVGVWIPEVLLTAKPQARGLSQWVPRWVYWIPWNLIGWRPERIRKYQEALKSIKQKHNL